VSNRIEGVYSLQLGIVRRQLHTQRRYGIPIPSPLVFYARAIADSAKAMIQWGLSAHDHADPLGSGGAPVTLTRHCDRISGDGDVDKLVDAFADKIPDTHGAPVCVAAIS
jgi:hypothetical protein